MAFADSGLPGSRRCAVRAPIRQGADTPNIKRSRVMICPPVHRWQEAATRNFPLSLSKVCHAAPRRALPHRAVLHGLVCRPANQRQLHHHQDPCAHHVCLRVCTRAHARVHVACRHVYVHARTRVLCRYGAALSAADIELEQMITYGLMLACEVSHKHKHEVNAHMQARMLA